MKGVLQNYQIFNHLSRKRVRELKPGPFTNTTNTKISTSKAFHGER